MVHDGMRRLKKYLQQCHARQGLYPKWSSSALGALMADKDDNKVGMAECGSCRAVIPIDSKACPECNTSFQGVSDEALGECGACQSLVPLDSTRCPECSVLFVADDVVDVLRQWVSNTGIDLRKLFDKFDENGDGMIDSSELREGLLSLNLADLPPSQVERLVQEIDEDDNGVIDLDEFIDILSENESEAPGAATAEEEEDVNSSADDGGGDNDAANEDVGESSDAGDEEQDGQDEIEEDGAGDPVAEPEDEGADEVGDGEETDDRNDMSHKEVVSLKNPLLELANMMDEMGVSAQRVFNDLDRDGNGIISKDELMKLIESDYGEEMDMETVEMLMEQLDYDGDGSVDLAEFYASLEELDDHEDAVEDTVEEDYFPTPMQKRMMSKAWNDTVWPILHTGFALMLILVLVNALVGPVDGTGGAVVYQPMENGLVPSGLNPGDVFPCDEKYQEGGCSNSLTLFSGENGASSMPKGFYLDGIVFMILSLMGLGASLFMHLVRIPAWRARARAMREFETDKADAAQGEAEESVDEEATDEHDGSDDDVEHDDAEDDDVEESTDEDMEEDVDHDGAEDDEGDAGEDEIDVGSHIGLVFDDEEVFGTIVEFDDEEGTVTIEEDGTGDLVTGYQDDMFLE